MRLYIDLSCFNRPFDDQGQERVRLETEAVLLVLTRIMEGKDSFLWSWAMSFENDIIRTRTVVMRLLSGKLDPNDRSA
jgi:hypothetical protein